MATKSCIIMRTTAANKGKLQSMTKFRDLSLDEYICAVTAEKTDEEFYFRGDTFGDVVEQLRGALNGSVIY